MIYIPYLIIVNNTNEPYVNEDGFGSNDITKVNILYKYNNRLIHYGIYDGHATAAVYSDLISSGRSDYLALKEGWYINCMGQIYDWKGNIVE